MRLLRARSVAVSLLLSLVGILATVVSALADTSPTPWP
jgi:hypothetical protein